MESLLGFSQAGLYINFDKDLSPSEAENYNRLIARRGNREPAQYITETREFWSLDFRVNKSVLIPRPETEILIERALALKPARIAERRLPRILDIGTGSGNIAVSLTREIPEAGIVATDISLSALKLAAYNARLNGVGKRIEFIQADLLEPFYMGKNHRYPLFNLIVSNPPYIPSGQIEELSPEISAWEPRTALDGGPDGLDFYRKIIPQAYNCLAKNGVLLLETGKDQAEKIKEIAESCKSFSKIKVHKDYANKDRVIEIWKK
jgi:release factor glutamine methyltransferase